MHKNSNIDQFDLKILRELSVNGRITVTEFAGKVGLSKTPCLTRMRRLEARGYSNSRADGCPCTRTWSETEGHDAGSYSGVWGTVTSGEAQGDRRCYSRRGRGGGESGIQSGAPGFDTAGADGSLDADGFGSGDYGRGGGGESAGGNDGGTESGGGGRGGGGADHGGGNGW